ncbi:hypothetical protein ABT127_16815 [Streptomyces sp. NPDC001904]|uniref:hypothetical protein n=1 Tax=Streptomyces sp. NPDC001904 TaxID=3154531 RepID=UPI00332F65C8
MGPGRFEVAAVGASAVVTLCAWNVGADEREGDPGLEPVLALGLPLGVDPGVVPGVEDGVEPGVLPGVVPGVVPCVVFDGADVLDGCVLDDDVSVDAGVPVWAAAGCWTCVRGSCPADGSCVLPCEGACAEPGACAAPLVSWAAGALSEDVLMLCALAPDGVGEAVDVSAAARVSGPECGSGDAVPVPPESRCGPEEPEDPSAPPVSVCTEVFAGACCSRKPSSNGVNGLPLSVEEFPPPVSALALAPADDVLLEDPPPVSPEAAAVVRTWLPSLPAAEDPADAVEEPV